jgi:hypothetical protein
MLPRLRLLEHVKSLGREFKRRGMGQHVQRLRVYYIAVQKGLTSPSHELDIKWSEPFVVEWLKILRVPPFERAYSVRPRGSRCGRCSETRNEQTSVFTELNFPGGSKMRCQACEAAWVELD